MRSSSPRINSWTNDLDPLALEGGRREPINEKDEENSENPLAGQIEEREHDEEEEQEPTALQPEEEHEVNVRIEHQEAWNLLTARDLTQEIN